MERKDILGRIVKEGDLVVVKGDYSSRDMGIGIFTGTNVRCLGFLGDIVYRNGHDMYLIENPGPAELKCKMQIEEKLAERNSKNDAIKKGKLIQKANVPGMVYKIAKDDEVFLYCGKCIVETTEEIMSRSRGPMREEGHLYVSAGKNFKDELDEEKMAKLTFNDFFEYIQKQLKFDVRLVVLKSQKKYKTAFHTVQFPDEFAIEQEIGNFVKVTQRVEVIK